MHKILIDAAPNGYEVRLETESGEVKLSTAWAIRNMRAALDEAYVIAEWFEEESGGHIEPLVSMDAIRENHSHDLDARKLWNNPLFRAVIENASQSRHQPEAQSPFIG